MMVTLIYSDGDEESEADADVSTLVNIMEEGINDIDLGARYIEHSVDKRLYTTSYYIGEWFKKTKQMHGRGIEITNDGIICIGYWING